MYSFNRSRGTLLHTYIYTSLIGRRSLEREKFILDEHLEYLNELRESGETNMVGALPFLTSRYPELNKQEARKVLEHWMRTFKS